LSSKTVSKIQRLKILETRICDLPIKLNGTLNELIKKAESELHRKKIKFRPEFYLGLGWGCVQGSYSVEIPFWLATADLMKVEDQFNYNGVENEQEILMGLRHEVGHAINYTYRLYREKEWKRLFGNIKKKYKDYYVWNPWSKRHVKHLPDYYAQKHPDEDWAETFAVWLTPRSNWRNVYAKTPALDKLIYVDSVMNNLNSKISREKSDRDKPIEKAKMTVADFYDLNFEEIIDQDQIARHVDDLKRIFNYEKLKRNYYKDAWKFINRYSQMIVHNISDKVDNTKKDEVKKYLDQFISICKTYKLKIRLGDEEEKLVEIAILLTYDILNN
jgi:hypothetical protein